MDLQEATQLVAPWSATASAAIAIIAGAARYRSSSGLRSKMGKEAELAQALPDGEAKNAVIDAIEANARRYRTRVVDGYRPTLPQVLAMWGSVIVLTGLVALAVATAIDHGWGFADSDPKWISQLSHVTGSIAVGIGACVLLGTAAVAITLWLLRQMNTVFDDLGLPVPYPRLVRRRETPDE